MTKPVSIIGIPFDEKSSFKQGPANAPEAIRQCYHSGSANDYSESGKNVNTDQVSFGNDLKVQDYLAVENLVDNELNKGKRLLTLGGDHSITYPIIRAHRKHYDHFSILHIDAHADLYDEFEGDRYSHACPFARIMEEDLCDRLIQLGIRTLTTHQREQADRFGVEIIEMKDYALDRVPTLQGPVYISLDMDAFDPAFAPGVSHHEPGGFTSRQVIDLFQSLSVEVIGADIVEYNPDRDPSGITAALAAKMIRELLAMML